MNDTRAPAPSPGRRILDWLDAPRAIGLVLLVWGVTLLGLFVVALVWVARVFSSVDSLGSLSDWLVLISVPVMGYALVTRRAWTIRFAAIVGTCLVGIGVVSALAGLHAERAQEVSLWRGGIPWGYLLAAGLAILTGGLLQRRRLRRNWMRHD